jgi:uncharacterized iron-regulated membrane protein
MRITAYVTGIIPIVAIAMRFTSRWIGGNHIWWDDWIHFVSAVSLSAVTALVLANNFVLQGLVYPTVGYLPTQHQCGSWKAYMGLDVSTGLRDRAME